MAEQYRQRRREVLAAVSRLIGPELPAARAIERAAVLLHRLAGTAAFFGDGLFGAAAGRFEKALRRAPPDRIAKVLRDGYASLRSGDLAAPAPDFVRPQP